MKLVVKMYGSGTVVAAWLQSPHNTDMTVTRFQYSVLYLLARGADSLPVATTQLSHRRALRSHTTNTLLTHCFPNTIKGGF